MTQPVNREYLRQQILTGHTWHRVVDRLLTFIERIEREKAA